MFERCALFSCRSCLRPWFGPVLPFRPFPQRTGTTVEGGREEEEVEGGIEGGLSHFKLRAIHLLFATPLFSCSIFLDFNVLSPFGTWGVMHGEMWNRKTLTMYAVQLLIKRQDKAYVFQWQILTLTHWHSLDHILAEAKVWRWFLMPAVDPHQGSLGSGTLEIWLPGALRIPHGQSG